MNQHRVEHIRLIKKGGKCFGNFISIMRCPKKTCILCFWINDNKATRVVYSVIRLFTINYWKKWGIGQTRSEYAIKGNYEIQYEAVSNTNDLLYTIGSNWTLTLGISTIQSGEAKIQFLDHLYRSEIISGYGAIAGFGVRLGIFEFLLRKSISEYKFEELVREPSVEIEQPLRLKSDMLSLGIGLSF